MPLVIYQGSMSKAKHRPPLATENIRTHVSLQILLQVNPVYGQLENTNLNISKPSLQLCSTG